MKGKDGKYHIHGATYLHLIGSRASVMHGTAYKTSGGLLKKHLKYNKHHKIVSRAKSSKGPQMLKRLHRKGYFTRKGHFGWVKKGTKGARSKTHQGLLDYTTKLGDLVFHRRKHYVRKSRKPYTRKRKHTRKRRRRRRQKRRPIKGVKWEDRMRRSGRFTKKPSYHHR